jgi:predicted nucleic acid-binding protein
MAAADQAWLLDTSILVDVLREYTLNTKHFAAIAGLDVKRPY